MTLKEIDQLEGRLAVARRIAREIDNLKALLKVIREAGPNNALRADLVVSDSENRPLASLNVGTEELSQGRSLVVDRTRLVAALETLLDAELKERMTALARI